MKKKLVNTHINQKDKRVKEISLSKYGNKFVLETLEDHLTRLNDKMSAELSAEEITTFKKLIIKINQNMKE